MAAWLLYAYWKAANHVHPVMIVPAHWEEQKPLAAGAAGKSMWPWSSHGGFVHEENQRTSHGADSRRTSSPFITTKHH